MQCIWTVAEAKAKFSELVDQARTGGPQTITKRGQPTVVVVAAEEWERKTRRVAAWRISLLNRLCAGPASKHLETMMVRVRWIYELSTGYERRLRMDEATP